VPDEDEVTEPLNDEEEQVDISQWEFIDRIPTRAEVVALLETLAPVYGIEYKDFADHVQGLPSKKKVKKRQPLGLMPRVEPKRLRCAFLHWQVPQFSDRDAIRHH